MKLSDKLQFVVEDERGRCEDSDKPKFVGHETKV